MFDTFNGLPLHPPVVLGVACSVQLYRVGDSVARAAWGDTLGSIVGT